jgi:hypothetical protein
MTSHATRTAVVLVPLLALPFGGCGGSTTTQATADAGAPPGISPCPAGVPAAGSLCQQPLGCEYGSDPDLRCDTVANCLHGAWMVAPPASGAACESVLSPSCPPSHAALRAQDACDAVGASCAYSEARCACAATCGHVGFEAPDGAVSTRWCCLDAPPGPSCPSPRPRLGAPCDTEGQICDYGDCSGNVAVECSLGTWQRTPQLACPG